MKQCNIQNRDVMGFLWSCKTQRERERKEIKRREGIERKEDKTREEIERIEGKIREEKEDF